MFNPSQLNKAYYDLIELTKNPKKPIVVLYGGRNSSKTYSVQQWLFKQMWNTGANAVWYRNESSVLRVKVYDPLVSFAKSCGIDKYLTFNFSNQSRRILFPKGNTLYLDFCEGGKSKGIANITYVVIDEVDQVSLEDFLMLYSSYRGSDDIRFILMFNPVSDRHWLKRIFFDEPEKEEDIKVSLYGRSSKVKYTIEDNKFATQNDYDTLETFRLIDMNQYNIVRHGIWGSMPVENPFYLQFNHGIHVHNDVPIFDNYPIYLSFDFGKFDMCVMGQHFEDYEIGSDEQLLKYFKDSTAGNTRVREYAKRGLRQIVQEVIAEFGVDRDYIIYGDSAGGSDEWSKFAEIRNYMEDAGCYSLYFPKRIKLRQRSNGAITNWCLLMYGSNYKIDSRCKKLIEDFIAVRSDEYGNIDKNDAIRQNISHYSDCSRYLDLLTDANSFVRNNKYFVEKELGSRDAMLLE